MKRIRLREGVGETRGEGPRGTGEGAKEKETRGEERREKGKGWRYSGGRVAAEG